MPEAFAVVFVFAVAVAAYVGARLNAGDPARHNPAAELARMQRHRAWLHERLERARRENWGHDMTAPLARELAAVEARLSEATPGLRDAA